MIDHLFALSGKVRMRSDPQPESEWAIRCYAAAGFRPRGIFEGHEAGPMLCMSVKR